MAVTPSLFAQTGDDPVIDTLPAFRDFCDDSEVIDPDTVLYEWTSSIAITQDTTITRNWNITSGQKLVINNGVTVSFWDSTRLVVDGGTLIIGLPDSFSVNTGKRSYYGTCHCSRVTLRALDSCWFGILVRSGNLWMYATTLEKAYIGVDVKRANPPLNVCLSNAPADTPFVYIECSKIQSPPDSNFVIDDTLTYTNPYIKAGIWLEGNAAAKTMIVHTRIDGANYYKWGITARGNQMDGECASPLLMYNYIRDCREDGLQIQQNNTWDPECGRKTIVNCNGLRVENCGHSGVKVWGNAELHATKCEGGIDVVNSNHGINKVGIRVSSGNKTPVGTVAGLYMDENCTRVMVVNADTAGIFANHGAEIIDYDYTDFLLDNNGASSNDPQILALDSSSVILSYSTDSSWAGQRVMVHPTNNNLLRADEASYIRVVWAFFCSDTSRNIGPPHQATPAFPPSTDGSGTFEYDSTSQDSIRKPNLSMVCLPGSSTGSGTIAYKRLVYRGDFFRFDTPNIQIYPNPSTSGRTIGITLDSDESINLSIFDNNGAKVHSFANGQTYRRGVHFFNWGTKNHQSLPSLGPGVYYVFLETQSNFAVKKFLVVSE